MKILLFANTDWYLYNFRLALAQSLQAQGHEVILVSPPGLYVDRLQALGFCWVKFNLARRGLNLFSEGATIIRLLFLYRRERPDIVHHFTIKCVLYGSLVARLAGVKSVVNSVTGLGYVFSAEAGPKNWLRSIVMLLYRLALRRTKVIFQNPDDWKLFIEQGLVQSDNSVVIRGSGVDVDRFSPKPESAGIPIVLFPGRLLWDKGVGEFVSAARALRAKGVSARFVLVGDRDSNNPSSVPLDQIQEWVQKGDIEWWGWRDDMNEVYAQVHLICLPSYYKEGLPKALIEAASSGRPIITTDMPGCREIVREGKNGLLVPPRDPIALARAICLLLGDPLQRQQMGIIGREIAIGEFSKDRIIFQTLAVYNSMV
jgi:glycosyltransferase involved in cell wall biosynthesis